MRTMDHPAAIREPGIPLDTDRDWGTVCQCDRWPHASLSAGRHLAGLDQRGPGDGVGNGVSSERKLAEHCQATPSPRLRHRSDRYYRAGMKVATLAQSLACGATSRTNWGCADDRLLHRLAGRRFARHLARMIE